MKHYGDITKLSGYELPIVDVITGGSPCQDLSVAGKRAGLAGERSGLFMEQIRIVKEMREHDRELHGGRTDEFTRPRYMVWENVPGSLSSPGKGHAGEDFQAVLTEVVRIVSKDAPDVPIPDGGWPYCGCISGVGDTGLPFSVCWAVHDAQWWGVPQRRRRIALVADFNGLTAGGIMLNPQLRRETDGTESDETVAGPGGECGRAVQPVGTGLCGDSAESGEAREATPGSTEDGASAYTLKIRGGAERDSSGRLAGKGPLVQTELSATLGVSQDQTLIKPDDVVKSSSIHQNGSGEVRLSDNAYTLSTNSNASGRNTPLAVINVNEIAGITIPIHDQATRFAGKRGEKHDGKGNGLGIGSPEDPSPTISSGDHHAVFRSDIDIQNNSCQLNRSEVVSEYVPPVSHALKAKANLQFREDSETYIVGNERSTEP